MLGRRLLLLVAVLLATGAIAAALTPRHSGQTTPTTSVARPPVTAAPEVSRTVDAQGAEAAVVRARVGDLLHLVVKAPSPDVVALEGIGRFASVDASTPARFDFFLDSPGRFPIRLQESGREIGQLVVSAG